MSRKRVLVCDDDANFRKLIALLLSPDQEVLEAGDGEEALKLIDADPPDLVLLDIALPGRSGLEILDDARHRHPALKTIMLTGNDEIDTAAWALEHGAMEYVTKPFDPDLLKEEVNRILEEPLPAPRPGDVERPWRVRP